MSDAQLATAYAPPVPAAVVRAAARANELVQEQAAAPTVVEEPPAAATPTVVEPTAPPTPPAPPPADDWQQRYSSLQGKYNAEVPQLRAQVDGMQRLLAQLSTPQEPRPTPAAPTPAVAPDALEKDRKEFGPELFDAVERCVLALLNPRLVAIEQGLQRLTQGQGQVQTETKQQRVMSALDADTQLGKIWRQINSDPNFVGWLESNDPFTGQQRKMLLGAAFNGGDAVRTAAFFRAYIGEQTATTQPAPVPTPPTPPASQGTGQVTLESLAAPGRAAATPASSGANGEKRMWTRAEISSFYLSKQRGAYNGREAVAEATERDILAASTEGRVR